MVKTRSIARVGRSSDSNSMLTPARSWRWTERHPRSAEPASICLTTSSWKRPMGTSSTPPPPAAYLHSGSRRTTGLPPNRVAWRSRGRRIRTYAARPIPWRFSHDSSRVQNRTLLHLRLPRVTRCVNCTRCPVRAEPEVVAEPGTSRDDPHRVLPEWSVRATPRIRSHAWPFDPPPLGGRVEPAVYPNQESERPIPTKSPPPLR